MPSPLEQHTQRLLAYHEWAYRRLFEQVATLDDARYRADCGLFFGSLHGTLNHLAVGDRLWLARVRHEPAPFSRLDAEAATDCSGLKHFILAGAEAWRAEVARYTDAQLLAPLEYRTVAGLPQQRQLLDIITHVVNHGTHHRGQASAALTTMGQPAPVIDYIYATAELP